MLENLLKSQDFGVMMQRHASEILDLLLSKGVNFSILTNIAEVGFDPPLPEEITQGFKPITLFFLAGYTFESTRIDGDILSFEAGFGSQNFGSLVSVPIASVLQIIIDEVPLFINLASPPKPASKRGVEPKETGVKRSMDALMSNPRNQKLLKKEP